MRVVFHHNDNDREIGSIEVAYPDQLKDIVAADWRPVWIDGKPRSFRFHGYRWRRNGNALTGVVWVSEG
jgi:hypothetical protein